MHRAQLYVPQSIWKSVQQEARAQHVTASAVVRGILDKYFMKNILPVKKTEGLLEFSQRMNKKYPGHAPKDLALNLDHYLYGGPKKYPTTDL